LGVGLLALVLPACEQGGHFTILGYTTRPNYDDRYKTIHVPIFKNLTFYRGLEFQVTQAVIREIMAKTPYRVVSNRESADTELSGTLTAYTKNILNRNQLNEIREMQTVLTVEVTWKDLHTGEYLTKGPRKPGEPLPPPPVVAPNLGTPVGSPVSPLTISAPTQPLAVSTPAAGQDEQLPQPTPLPDAALPPEGLAPGSIPAPGPPGPSKGPVVVVQSLGDYIPEIGMSLASAEQQNVNNLAIQIVSMMEKPW
jgi:hypothetical protein